MNLSVAIPDSSLADESTRMDKSAKVSIIARACAVFGVDTIHVYGDGGSKADSALLTTLLRYAETPPYLRRSLFPKMAELKFAGVLHPLKIHSHTVPTDPKRIKAGDVRDGIVVLHKGGKFIDVGLARPLRYHGTEERGRRATVKLAGSGSGLEASDIVRSQVGAYWGYSVRERGSLYGLLSEYEGRVILTSRKGKPIAPGMMRSYSSADVLVAFGSTERGLHDMLGPRIKKLQNSRVLDFFPSQNTETVRLDEAILGVLAILKSGL